MKRIVFKRAGQILFCGVLIVALLLPVLAFAAEKGEEAEETLGFGTLSKDYDPSRLKSENKKTQVLAISNQRYFDDFFGLSPGTLYENLKYHENDGFYTGTRYVGVTANAPLLASNTPMGDAANYALGYGFNCCGFVMRAIFEAAASPGGLDNYREWFKSKGIGAGLTNDYNPADMGVLFDEFFYAPNKDKYIHYEYASREACIEGINKLIDGDLISSGAIIATMPNDSFYAGDVRNQDSFGNYIDCHIGFYWNESGGHIDTNSKVYWNATHPTTGLGSTVVDSITQVSNVNAKCAGCTYYVFPLAPIIIGPPEQKPDQQPESTVHYLRIQKSFEGGMPSDYSPSKDAAIYRIYKDAGCTQPYTTPYIPGATSDFSIEADGYSGIIPVDAGIYYIKEIKAPDGYLLDQVIYRADVIDAGTTISNPVIVSSTDQLDTGGFGKLKKQSANSQVTAGNNAYSLEGAEYGVYKDNGCTSRLAVLTTGSDGVSSTVELDAGTYYVKEMKAPQGYALNSKVYTITIKRQETTVIEVEDIPQYNPIDLMIAKYDAEKTYNSSNNLPQGGASLEGAEFTVKFYAGLYDSLQSLNGVKATRTWVLRTDAKGYAYLNSEYLVSGDSFYTGSNGNIILPLGTVTVQETKAPKGYLLCNETYFKIIEGSGSAEVVNAFSTIQVNESVIRGGVRIQKRDFDTEETLPQGDASLANAIFDIISLNECDVIVDGVSYSENEVVASVATNTAGIAETRADALPFGTYKIIEASAPEGYLNEGIIGHEFVISENGEIIDMTDSGQSMLNKVIRGGVEIQKVDSETGEGWPQGNARLVGAEYAIKNISPGEVIVNGETYAPNEVVIIIKTGEDGTAATETNVLPYGTYEIYEVKPSDGYLLDDMIQIFEIREDNFAVELKKDFPEQVKRGDLELLKISSTGERLAGIPFRITSKTTGEYHTIITDKNGYASTESSWNPHSQNTNAGEESTDGVWFGSEEPSDDKGALIYDTYIIEELPCGRNKGFELIEPFEIDILRDKYTLSLGTLTNEYREIDMHTTASEAQSGEHTGIPSENVTIYDKVEMKGLLEGDSYTVKGILMDKATQQPYLVEGEKVVGETTFVADAEEYTATVEFNFDGSALGNRDLVVYEKLYYEDQEILKHEDINDESQTVKFKEADQEPEPETESEPEPELESELEVESEPELESEKPVILRQTQTPKTGDSISLLSLCQAAVLTLVSATIISIIVMKKRG